MDPLRKKVVYRKAEKQGTEQNMKYCSPLTALTSTVLYINAHVTVNCVLINNTARMMTKDAAEMETSR